MDTETKNCCAGAETLKTLPGDDVRSILWRFADRYDLQMLVQSTRSVARGPVAHLVAEGARNTHEWTDDKAQLPKLYDESGVTAAGLEPEFGGFIEGPKNLALSLVAFELAWVDAGASTCSLANDLAFAPIHERGTPEQFAEYQKKSAPAQPGEDRECWKGAFCLTEPLPYVGVDTGILNGKVRVAEWEEGKEPILQVDKRGRFITNMGFAKYVTAAVDTADKRIKSSCMIILEEGDEGLFDRGVPARKMVHQLSSTRDPIFSLRVPASRIIGGYDIKDGVIVPRYNHGDIIEAVFRRTRVTVALMSAAKLLSAVEPVIRYQRCRFRGGDVGAPGTARYDLGIQQREDALQRLVDVWATGEAAAALGFAAARFLDEFEPVDRAKDKAFEEMGISGARAKAKLMRRLEADALEFLALSAADEAMRDQARYEQLKNDTLVQFVVGDAIANVLVPACKLWNTGYGGTMMREAVSLMGGYGITEDCPGFLGNKWMDAQLEATYEGPEAVQRRQMSVTMTNPLFLTQFKVWIEEMRRVAATHPQSGACTTASAMEMWLWTVKHIMTAKDANGNALYAGPRQGVTFPLADALCWVLGSRQQILDYLELEAKGPENPVVAEGLEGYLNFYGDLCHLQAARSAGEVGRICAELVHGYGHHATWDESGCACCYESKEAEALESVVPGAAAGSLAFGEVFDNGKHAEKAGPCVRMEGLEQFMKLRLKLDGCLTGARLAKDRAAQAVAKVMIPEALDYPL